MTEPISDQIKPCPNPACHASVAWPEDDEDGWWVACGQCDMQGPFAESIDAAIVAWNALPRGPEWVSMGEGEPTEYGNYWVTAQDRFTEDDPPVVMRIYWPWTWDAVLAWMPCADKPEPWETPND